MWWHTVTHGRGSEGGNWRMEWVASTLHSTSEHGVSGITTADVHTSAASSRLNWRALPNGLVCFAKRRSLVSARVPPYFNWPLHPTTVPAIPLWNNVLTHRIKCRSARYMILNVTFFTTTNQFMFYENHHMNTSVFSTKYKNSFISVCVTQQWS